MAVMGEDEWRAFLREPAATAKPATVRPDVGRRYMGAERAEAYGHRNAVPDEPLVRVKPSRVVARRDIAD